ncbi:MAG: LPXTG cell wall anchor domain-containing protein, partial [Ruminococcus callidus]|nr:LPXTG cell wall anchor domain-containing protein [Ruminococcus callidus]
SYVKLKGSVEGATVMAAASESGNFIFAPFAYASVPLEAVGGQIAEIKVKVSESAKPGDTFTLSIDGKDSDGVETSYKNGETGESGVPGSGAGTITIAEDPTEPTTEAPTTVVTEATTAAPTATPVAATTTAAKVATPTKPAKSTSSPKTGDALPVAGVAVAVAVIGGVALVAKKRK